MVQREWVVLTLLWATHPAWPPPTLQIRLPFLNSLGCLRVALGEGDSAPADRLCQNAIKEVTERPPCRASLAANTASEKYPFPHDRRLPPLLDSTAQAEQQPSNPHSGSLSCIATTAAVPAHPFQPTALRPAGGSGPAQVEVALPPLQNWETCCRHSCIPARTGVGRGGRRRGEGDRGKGGRKKEREVN